MIVVFQSQGPSLGLHIYLLTSTSTQVILENYNSINCNLPYSFKTQCCKNLNFVELVIITIHKGRQENQVVDVCFCPCGSLMGPKCPTFWANSGPKLNIFWLAHGIDLGNHWYIKTPQSVLNQCSRYF